MLGNEGLTFDFTVLREHAGSVASEPAIGLSWRAGSGSAATRGSVFTATTLAARFAED